MSVFMRDLMYTWERAELYKLFHTTTYRWGGLLISRDAHKGVLLPVCWRSLDTFLLSPPPLPLCSFPLLYPQFFLFRSWEKDFAAGWTKVVSHKSPLLITVTMQRKCPNPMSWEWSQPPEFPSKPCCWLYKPERLYLTHTVCGLALILSICVVPTYSTVACKTGLRSESPTLSLYTCIFNS